VSRIIPVIARRTDAHLAAASAKRVERWQRIARQASEQSRRSVPPEIAAPVRLAEIFNQRSGLRIVLSESEDQVFLCDAVKSNAADGVLLAIGPEGGWADDELQSFQQAGWTSASLGNTILRAETAAIAATAIVSSALSSL
jgi:16S rRNA (uracil1498-N3)-methyltransferase